MYLTPILSSEWGSAGPASAPQRVCAECLSSCYSRCRHNSSPDSTDQTMTGTTPDHKENHSVLPWHMDLSHTYAVDTSWCRKLNMPLECGGLTAVQTYQMTCDLIDSLGDKLYKLSSSVQIAFIGRCGAVLCTLQSRASSFCGSLHGNENVNYLAQVSHYYVAC